MGLVVIGVLAVIIIIWFIGQSNRLNRYVVSIEESKKTVDITLVKRHDTIAEMLKVAKAYAKHEEKVFTELVSLRKSGSINDTNRIIANPCRSGELSGFAFLAAVFNSAKRNCF